MQGYKTQEAEQFRTRTVINNWNIWNTLPDADFVQDQRDISIIVAVFQTEQ